MKNNDSKKMLMAYFKVFKRINHAVYQQDQNVKVYPGQPTIMVHIKHHEGLSQKEFAKLHCTAPASITGMFQKLEQNGLIKRIPDEKDKRVLRIYLTEKGHEFASDCEKYIDEVATKLFKDFSEEEVIRYYQLMEKLQHNMADLYDQKNFSCGFSDEFGPSKK